MSEQLTPAASRERVKMVCTKMQQAIRGLRLYPADHPAAQRVLVEFTKDLTEYLRGFGVLALQIEEERLLFDGQEVYYQEEMRSNLAFLMYRDGLRQLTFRSGLDAAEVEAFADCLAHADDLAAVEHDLTTALWERDLQHVEYEAVNPFLGVGRELQDEAVDDLRDTVLRRLSELNPGSGIAGGSGGGSGGGGGGGGGGAFGAGQGESARGAGSGDLKTEKGGFAVGEAASPSDVIVTETDIQQGEYAVSRLGDTLDDFAVVLLEIAGFPSPPGEEQALPQAMSMVVERYFDAGNVDGLALVVDRLLTLQNQNRRPPEFAAEVFGQAATVERLTRLIEDTDVASPEQAKRVEDTIAKMRDWILPQLLEMLVDSSDKAVRKITLGVLDMKGGVPVEQLWPLMQDPRWYVVRNAVALATGSENPHLLEHLEPLLRHPDARVRREVIRSADTVSGTRPATLFARALNDEDSPVRVLAAHGLGRHGSRVQVTALEALVEARDFAARPAEEINAVLRAYATLGGDATVEMLNKIWRRKILGTRPMPVRLGAVQALGAVQTPAARQALAQAAKCGESQIQRMANRALAEARARS